MNHDAWKRNKDLRASDLLYEIEQFDEALKDLRREIAKAEAIVSALLDEKSEIERELENLENETYQDILIDHYLQEAKDRRGENNE